MLSVTDALIAGERLTYVSYFGDTPFARHWTIYEGTSRVQEKPDPPLHRIVFLSETDTSLIGLGGPVMRIRAELICESNLFPRHYRVETRESINDVLIDDQIRIRLPDGTAHPVASRQMRCILGENFGQMALFLKLAQDEVSGGFSFSFFSFGAASILDYRISNLDRPAPADGARWFVSSFDEELLISPDGWLVEHIVPKEGVITRREDVPLPEWMETTILEPPLRYKPPENVHFYMKDVEVPGPVVRIGTSLTIPRGETTPS